MSWLGEVILPFIEAKRIRKAVQSRVGQMTPQEIAKNTEKHSILFYNKKFRKNDPILREELSNFDYVEKLLLTKDTLYIPEKKSSNKIKQ